MTRNNYVLYAGGKVLCYKQVVSIHLLQQHPLGRGGCSISNLGSGTISEIIGAEATLVAAKCPVPLSGTTPSLSTIVLYEYDRICTF